MPQINWTPLIQAVATAIPAVVGVQATTPPVTSSPQQAAAQTPPA